MHLTSSLNQLPFLDARRTHLWSHHTIGSIAEQDLPVLRADKSHTVRSLTGKLLELARDGMADSGFPVLQREPGILGDDRISSGLRVVGFIGMAEMDHALGTSELCPQQCSYFRRFAIAAQRRNQPHAR